MVFSLSNKQLQLLDQDIVASIATISSKGVPHISVAWIVMQDAKFYISTPIESKMYKNIGYNEHVSVSIIHPETSVYLTFTGNATRLNHDDYNEYEDVVERIIRKYVTDFDKATEMIDNVIHDNERVLVEIIPKEKTS